MPVVRAFFVRHVFGPHLRVLSFVVVVIGFLWLSIFHVFDRKTEVEEHGLIPGFSTPHFSFKKPEEKRLAESLFESSGMSLILFF